MVNTAEQDLVGTDKGHPQFVLAIGQAFAWGADLLRTGDAVESISGRFRHSVT